MRRVVEFLVFYSPRGNMVANTCNTYTYVTWQNVQNECVGDAMQVATQFKLKKSEICDMQTCEMN